MGKLAAVNRPGPGVCVVDAGAIGTFIGARLSRSGCQVSALARGATAASLCAHGFRLVQDGAIVTAPVRVAEDTAGLGAHDLVSSLSRGRRSPRRRRKSHHG